MKKNNNVIKSLVNAVTLASLTTTAANAGGFSLYTEGSAAAIGNFAAGIAAEGTDASIGWYNPAGLVLIKDQEAVFSGVGVLPSTALKGTSTFSAKPPLLLPPYVQNFSNENGAKNAFVPAFHYAKPLGERATFGFSVVSPFGLSTEYATTSPVRYAATFTELLTVNASPEIAGKLTDNFSVGAGLDLQWARVKFNRMLGAPILAAAVPFYTATSFDSLSYNRGHSFGVGFHAGLLGMFNDNHTRLGVNYQSKMQHKFHGYSKLTGPLANVTPTFGTLPPFPDASFRNNNLNSNEIELPDIVTLSGYQDVNDKLALLGSVIYTGWGVFKNIELNNVAAGSPTSGQVVVNSNAAQNYKDAWRFAVGANYKVNEIAMIRAGFGYDETPTNNIDRDVRLPDQSRWALSLGGHYQAWPTVGVDVGYSYLWANKDATINKTESLGTTSAYNVNARATNVHAHLIGIQAVWLLDSPEKMVTK